MDQSTTLYKSNSAKCNINITKSGSDTYVNIVTTPSAKPTYTLIIDSKGGTCHIVDVNANGIGYAKNIIPYYSNEDYTRFMTYIYNVTSLVDAEYYKRIFPYQAGEVSSLKLGLLDGILTITTSSSRSTYEPITGCINTRKADLYVKTDDKIYHLPPDVPIFIPQSVSNWKVRDTELPSSVCWQDLSVLEKTEYIPNIVAYGETYTINYTRKYVWVKALDYIYNGTLTYVETKDKDIHMISDTGIKFRYGLDNFRELIPYMYNGTVSGSFKFVGRGSRQIKYVLVPYLIEKDGGGDLIICDSDSSDDDT